MNQYYRVLGISSSCFSLISKPRLTFSHVAILVVSVVVLFVCLFIWFDFLVGLFGFCNGVY